MWLFDRFRSEPVLKADAVFMPEPAPEYEGEFKQADLNPPRTTFGEPVYASYGPETFLEQTEFEHELLITVADYLAEAFCRAEVIVVDRNGFHVEDHPIERAYYNPKGGRGPFWRGTMRDWIEPGLWMHGYDKTPGRRIFRAFRIPRSQMQVPQPYQYRDPIWIWTKPYGGIQRMYEHEFTFGAWRPDDGNEFEGRGPFHPNSLRNVLRRDKAAARYESDAYQRSGGQGLLFNSPTVAKIEQMKTEEQRDAAFAEIQETFEKRTTGAYRGSPLVLGDDTTVSTYGVKLRDMVLDEVHARAAERILAVFQIPPAAIGIRIGRDPTYANARVWEAVAYERGIKPRMREFEDRLGESLLTQTERARGYTVKFKTDDEIRAKLEDRQILERMHLNRLREGAVAVWEVRPHLEDVNPDPSLEAQLQAALMLRLAGASPSLEVQDPRLSAILADAIELGNVAPIQRLEGEEATVQGYQFEAEIERLDTEISDVADAD